MSRVSRETELQRKQEAARGGTEEEEREEKTKEEKEAVRKEGEKRGIQKRWCAWRV